jgi:3-methyl-2-oxobutanoate hydroxymethyltransferase
MQDALDLQAAGCFAIVFEAIPAEVTNLVMPHLSCLVIGIGAGRGTDGQVLVLHDLLGMHDGHLARFVRQFADVRGEMRRGVEAYAEAVRSAAFPTSEHSYAIPAEELELLRARWVGQSAAHEPMTTRDGRAGR